MIATNDFKKGIKIDFKGEPCEIIDFQHVKIGRGGAYVKTKLKGLKTGKVIEETFNSGDKFPKADLEEKDMQFLYTQDNLFYFMDMETYEQTPLTREQLDNAVMFLKENMNVKILYYQNQPLTVELPIFVDLQIVETEPGFKGDTASGGSKPAKLETGINIKVPFHINEGDIVKVDTRTSTYIERIK